MNKKGLFLSIGFFAFMVWGIYMANTGQRMFLFDIADKTPMGDKVGHFFAFGLICWFLNYAFEYKRMELFSISIFKGTFWVASFAILEEFSQAFISTRSFDLVDLTFDGLGMLVFSYVSLVLSRRYKVDSVQ